MAQGASVNAIRVNDLKRIRAAITRPNNTTAYTAGDVIAAVTTDNHYTFSDVVVKRGNTGEVMSARLYSSANVATKLDGELYLFHTDIAEVGDNEALAATDAELLTLVGVIDFATADWKVTNAGSGADGNAFCEVNGLGLMFQAKERDLYGVLVARNAYAPVASEIFTCELLVRED